MYKKTEFKGYALVVEPWAQNILEALLSNDSFSLEDKLFVGRFGSVCYNNLHFLLGIFADDQTVEFDYIYESSIPLKPSLENKATANDFAQKLNLTSPFKWSVSQNVSTRELRLDLQHTFKNESVPDIVKKLVTLLQYLEAQRSILSRFADSLRQKEINAERAIFLQNIAGKADGKQRNAAERVANALISVAYERQNILEEKKRGCWVDSAEINDVAKHLAMILRCEFGEQKMQALIDYCKDGCRTENNNTVCISELLRDWVPRIYLKDRPVAEGRTQNGN